MGIAGMGVKPVVRQAATKVESPKFDLKQLKFDKFVPGQHRHTSKKGIDADVVGTVGGKKVLLSLNSASSWSTGSTRANVTLESPTAFGKARVVDGPKLTLAQVRDLVKVFDAQAADPKLARKDRTFFAALATDLRENVLSW